MYSIITTDTFVIDVEYRGEADAFFYLYTEELGLVRAFAQGIRLQGSKLKGHLDIGGLAFVSLVRGREFWRIVGALRMIELPLSDRKKINLTARVLNLVKRLVHGEEKNHNLFQNLRSFFDALKLIGANDLEKAEIVILMRVLNALGYWSNQDCVQILEGSFVGSLETEEKKRAVATINMALKETQL